MSALITLITLPLLAFVFIVFVNSGCKFEFTSKGTGWLACRNALAGNDQIDNLQHLIAEMDRTNAVVEGALRNDISEIKSEMRVKDRRHDTAVNEAANQLRMHLSEQLASRDNTIAELRRALTNFVSDQAVTDKMLTYRAPFDENGLFVFIGTQGGKAAYQNPHNAGWVTASRSSSKSGEIADLVGREYVNSHTDNLPSSWMAVDIGAHRSISLTHYCLRTRTVYGASHSMRNWEFEAAPSEKGPFVVISRHVNDTALKTATPQDCWRLVSNTNNQNPHYYRYFRVRQTGPNSENAHFLILSGLELYGHLKIQKYPTF